MFISATDMAGRAPRGVVAHRNWQAALEAVWAGLEQGHGTVVVLGAAGTGKSLMLGVLSERLRAAGTPATLARRVDCGLAMDAAGTLLIDEADALGDAALDCVAARAGGCVIAGLPSFGGRLARFLHPARLRPVRVVELQAVADDEVGAFAQSVLLRRGRWDGTISAAAARALAEASGGVARLIDALSTCAEYVASLEHAPRIEARHVDEAIALGVGGWAVTAPAHGRDPLDTVSGTPASTASTRALVPDGPELMSHAGDFVDAPISLGTVALIERARQSRRDSMNKAGTERDAIAWRGPVLASLVAAAVAAVAITAVLREGLPGPGNWQRVATIGDAAVQVARARPPGATTPPSEAALAQATPTPAIPLPAARSPSSRGEAPQGPAGSKPAEATPARPVVSLPTLPVPKPATAPAPLAAELPVEAAPATPSQPASVAAVPVEAVQVESPPVGTALARAIPVRSIPAKSIPAKSIPAGADPVEDGRGRDGRGRACVGGAIGQGGRRAAASDSVGRTTGRRHGGDAGSAQHRSLRVHFSAAACPPRVDLSCAGPARGAGPGVSASRAASCGASRPGAHGRRREPGRPAPAGAARIDAAGRHRGSTDAAGRHRGSTDAAGRHRGSTDAAGRHRGSA